MAALSQGFTGRWVAAFSWIADRPEPPPQWDLRRIGWIIAAAESGEVCLLDWRGADEVTRRAADRARCIALGVERGPDRAKLLDAGWGDVLAPGIELTELAQRVRRLATARELLPRRRQAGAVTLDLLRRDARAGISWLALHPREFALLWRLAERPGEAVSRSRLLREVWLREHDPGTNTVEVHVSRLRSKLAGAGAGGLVETHPQGGGYRIAAGGTGFEPVCAELLDRRLCARTIS